MNLLKTFGLVVLIIAAASASPQQGRGKNSNHNSKSMKPTDWLAVSELQNLPAADDITLEQLESMSAEEGQRMIDKIFHLSKLDHTLEPSFKPSASNVPVIFLKPNGQLIECKLNEMVEKAKELPEFGDEEVTIFITGLPQSSPAVAKANKRLVQAYKQRYYGKQQPINSNGKNEDDGDNQAAGSSEEDYNESWKQQRQNKGNLMIINLGAMLTNMRRYWLLDIEETGEMIGKKLVELTNEVDVPQEIIHLIGQGIGAQVAGVAGRQYTRQTGHQLRRITGLDPAKWLACNKKMLSGLARGDADFVDAIHTSTWGLGTRERVGDIDFFVNGPSSIVPGAANVVEAAMRATRYFAESVRPGNECNFPAVPANSMHQYENKEGNGKRTCMGFATDFDLKGDYMLDVNAKSPFGKRAPAMKQRTYHGVHEALRSNNMYDE